MKKYTSNFLSLCFLLSSIFFISSCLKGGVGEPGPSGPAGVQGPAGVKSLAEFTEIVNLCITMPNALALPNVGGTFADCNCQFPTLYTYSDPSCTTVNMSTALAAFYLPTCSINDFYLTAHVIDSSAEYLKLTCS